MTQIVIANDPDALATRLAGVDGLIVFDGPPGAGKSHLAAEVASRLGCRHVDGDDHVDRERGVYVGALRVTELRSAIALGLAQSPRAILHCVCACNVVTSLGLAAAANVYVQRMSAVGVPGNPDMLTAEETGKGIELPGKTEFTRELLAYHARHKPAASADILYRRTE
jgi:hypothetical protein